jgi:hypothetical protein
MIISHRLGVEWREQDLSGREDVIGQLYLTPKTGSPAT